ncbi:sporulation protein YunB [Longirhabdus pacifica]|uniref:sporulation protein YunB n=1 Tax=Longirhabdus pacifica TaxID=2305227 RepID=UPI001008A012|nr:sporulation protein YunB [Longirhabdus pacifica]
MFRRKRRWSSSKQGSKKSKRKVFFIVFIIMLLLGMQTFIFIERNLRTPLMNVAKIRIKQVATQSINKAITEKISQATNFDKLIDWRTDQKGKITGFMLNYAEHMKITADTVTIVQNTLNELQKIPEHIPIGQAFNSAIISSFGPEVKVKFVPAGAVKVDLKTRQKDAGINMLLVEVYIQIVTEVTIIIPFDTKPEIVQTDVPISYLLVVGDVPTYYFDNKGNPAGNLNQSGVIPPSISIPEINDASNSESE